MSAAVVEFRAAAPSKGRPWTPAYHDVLMSATLSPLDKTVFFLIASYVNREKPELGAWPSVRTLAPLAPCSHTSVVRAIANLEAQGWLRLEPRKRGGGKQRGLRYHLLSGAPTHHPSGAPMHHSGAPTFQIQKERTSSSTHTLRAQRSAGHRAHHPRICSELDTDVRICMPETLVGQLARRRVGMSDEDAVAYVIAWARADRLPEGCVVPGNDFDHWRKRWDQTHEQRGEERGPSYSRPAARGGAAVPDAEATNELIKRLASGDY